MGDRLCMSRGQAIRDAFEDNVREIDPIDDDDWPTSFAWCCVLNVMLAWDLDYPTAVRVIRTFFRVGETN
jgi:hypothetical protein